MINKEEIAKLLLRLSLSLLMLFHGFHKVIHGIGGVKTALKSNGIPEVLAYGIYIGEVVAPIMLLIGYYSRYAAGVIALTMLSAIYLVYFNSLLVLGKHGAPVYELPLLFFVMAVVSALIGPGKYSADKH